MKDFCLPCTYFQENTGRCTLLKLGKENKSWEHGIQQRKWRNYQSQDESCGIGEEKIQGNLDQDGFYEEGYLLQDKFTIDYIFK